MAGFFKNLFGSRAGKSKPRKLPHPRDLRIGDIVKFQYIDQSDVSGKEFEVSQINTYLYDDLCYPELVLKDRSSNIIYLMVEEEDGDEYLALSKKVSKTQMSEIISHEDMSRILKQGSGIKIGIITKPLGFESWLTDNYRVVDNNIIGSFVKGDARYLSSEEINRQEHFTSYILENSDNEYGLEIEVYKTGETELSVTVYHDIEGIEEMWPGSVVE
jgi:hypothetical protein